MTTKEILEGIARVEAWNATQRFKTTEGRYPCCKPMLRNVSVCERCGNQIAEMKGKPCPAIPLHQRWDTLAGSSPDRGTNSNNEKNK